MLGSNMTLTPLANDFIKKVKSKKAVVGIIGLGYVGIPLAQAFTNAGLKVIGFDVSQEKVEKLNAGKSLIKHISDETIAKMRDSGLFEATMDSKKMSIPDALLICVPTPLNTYREPDLTYVVDTVQTIAKQLRKGQLVVLESTTYPGTSEEVIRPILEETGFSSKSDFGIAYSPEREDPGNPNFGAGNIPKVVGADSADASAMAEALYKAAVSEIVPVKNTRTAEAVKLTENIFRLVNIALVNELKTIYKDMDIDAWEVIDAAKTKPFGFMPFYPGPGLGGHCIPIDPFYLTWKARAFGRPTRFIELAGEINNTQPANVVEAVVETLNLRGKKALAGAKILLIGMSYKPDVDDLRESPAFIIWEMLEKRLADVVFHDPFIPEIPYTHEHEEFTGRQSIELNEGELRSVDLAIIVTHHKNVEYDKILQHVPLVIDTRNALQSFEGNYADKIFKA